MIITKKNYQKYFDKPCFISFPRKRVFATVLFHFLILHLGALLMYGYLAYIALPLIAWELYYTVYFVRKLWCRVGYSQAIFFAILFVKFAADFFLSVLERQFLWDFFA